MSLSSAVIDAMVAAGCTAEQLGAAVKAANAERERMAVDRRAKDAERKRRQREMSRDVTRTTRDIRGHDGTPSPEVPSEVSPAPPSYQPPNPNQITPFAPLKGGSSPAKRASRLSEDWSLPDEWRQDAIDAGLAPDRIDAEAAKMRDWSRSSQAGAKLDWRPAWRNWCRKAAGELPRGRPPPRAPTQSDVFKLIGERAAASGQDSGDRGGVRPAILDLRPARTG